MKQPLVAVVILNYNGKKLLQQFMPSVLANSPGAIIYVADNASTDDSVAFVKQEYPQVQVIAGKKNYGFAQGYNEALRHVQADYYVLLNSDVEVTPHWLEPVIAEMEANREVAAVQPKILAYNERDSFEYAGACGGFIDKYGYPFCRGRIFNDLEKDAGQYNDTAEIFWATGACLFVRAGVFHEMKGFDESYFAHMEEIDLCWRIKNSGRTIKVVPASVVYHLGGGTLNKISPRKTFLNFRNNLVTFTKNYPNGNWFFVLWARLVLDGVAGLKFLLEGKPAHTWAVVRAHWTYYFTLAETLRKRKENKSLPGYAASFRSFYMGNIVLEFYLRGKRKFSQLAKEKFSA